MPHDQTEADRRALALHAEVEERVEDQDVRTAIPGEDSERGVDRPAPHQNEMDVSEASHQDAPGTRAT